MLLGAPMRLARTKVGAMNLPTNPPHETPPRHTVYATYARPRPNNFPQIANFPIAQMAWIVVSEAREKRVLSQVRWQAQADFTGPENEAPSRHPVRLLRQRNGDIGASWDRSMPMLKGICTASSSSRRRAQPDEPAPQALTAL